MFCTKCGKQLDDNARFCTGCGQPIIVNDVSSDTGDSPRTVNEAEQRRQREQQRLRNQQGGNAWRNQGRPGERPPQRNGRSGYQNYGTQRRPPRQIQIKKIPKKVIILIIAIAAAAIAASVVYYVLVGNKVNMNKYIEIEAEGYDGYGTVTYTFDTTSFLQENKNKIKLNTSYAYYNSMKDELNSQNMTAAEIIAYYYSSDMGNLDQYENLSNGDEVTFTWSFTEEELEEVFSNDFKLSDVTYTVSGLGEIDTFDAFEDIEVVFSGTEPYGYAEIQYSDDMDSKYYDLYFYLDQYSELSNGDTVEVIIDDFDVQEYVAEYDMVPAEMSKTYTVEGLGSYVTSLDDLSDDLLAQMQSQSKDIITANAASDFTDGVTLGALEYLGAYLLTQKSGYDSGTANIIYLVYKETANIKSSENNVNTSLSYYTYVKFENVVISSDGDADLDLSSASMCYESFSRSYDLGTGWYTSKNVYFDGYETLSSLYNDVVTTQIDRYTAESSVNAEGGEAVETEEAEEEDSEDYILPNSDTKKLTTSDLEGLTQSELKIARNEIYARHGRKFDDDELQAYFDSKSWYTGTIEPDDFSESMLNDVEIYNRDFIVAYETEKGYRK